MQVLPSNITKKLRVVGLICFVSKTQFSSWGIEFKLIDTLQVRGRGRDWCPLRSHQEPHGTLQGRNPLRLRKLNIHSLLVFHVV